MKFSPQRLKLPSQLHSRSDHHANRRHFKKSFALYKVCSHRIADRVRDRRRRYINKAGSDQVEIVTYTLTDSNDRNFYVEDYAPSLNRADGDKIDAGDVIANLEVSITEEQLAQLENSVELAKANYEQLQQGRMVKVEVRKPVTKTVVRPQTTQRQVSNYSSDLSALAERKDRMEKLYEMGAISRVQRDAAVAEYEAARSSSYEPQYEEVEGAPTVDTVTEYVTEYVEQFQPTPPEILEGAQLAIKQAEMSLNTARQEAQQTAVIAPVSGTIYYDVANDQEIKAGAPVAKIGDSQELWLEAEVTEDQFYRLSLGKLVSYTIDGQIFNGTVIEKIAPNEYRGVGGPLIKRNKMIRSISHRSNRIRIRFWIILKRLMSRSTAVFLKSNRLTNRSPNRNS